MFEVGFTELLLIFALALIVLGPEKLPRVASQVGRWIGRARSMARQFREQLEDETILEETTPKKRPTAGATPSPADATSTADTATPSGDPVAPSADAASEVPRQKYYQPDDDVSRADVSHADAGAESDPPQSETTPAPGPGGHERGS